MSLPPEKPRRCPECSQEFVATAGQISQCPGCGKNIIFRDEIGIVEYEKGEEELSQHADLDAKDVPPPHPQQPSWLATTLRSLAASWHPHQVAIERFFINWWPAWLLSFTSEERKSLRKAIQGRFRITTLHDPRVAKWLAATGEPIPLQGLTSLSPPVARQLIESSDSLWLTGLLGFCETTARHLSFHRGRTLYLDGLRSLPDSIAQILVRHRGRGLSLDGLTTLPTSTAEVLITYRGRLSLDGLRDLTPSLAALLAMHRGPSLSLNGITTLSTPIAEQLSSYQGDLYLGGITELTGILATIFRDFPGKIVLRHHEIRPRRRSSDDAIEKESIKPLITLGVVAGIIILALLAVLLTAMDAIGS